MKKWIEIITRHPIVMLSIAGALTMVSLGGLARLTMDASMESLMPERDATYLLLQRAREVYGNRKTLIITAFEGRDREILNSPDLHAMSDMVDELREFQDIDPQEQEARLILLLRNAGASVISQEADQMEPENAPVGPASTTEDTLLLEGIPTDTSKNSVDHWDIGDFSTLNATQTNRRSRAASRFSFSDYKATNLESLSEGLSEGGLRDLKTIAHRLNIADWKRELSQTETEDILKLMEQVGRLKRQRIIREIIDPIRGEDLIAEGDMLRVRPFVDRIDGRPLIPDTDERFAAYTARLTRNPSAESTLYAVNAEGKIISLAVAVMLRNEGDYEAFVEHYLSLVQRREIRSTTAGDLILDRALNNANQKDMGFYLPLSLLMIILTFWLNFRSIRLMALLTTSVLAGTLWTLGAMGWLGIPLTITGSLLPPILITVASSYGIHICNRFLIDVNDGRSETVKHSLTSIAPTIFLASVTTIAGFLALSLNEVRALREFGIFAALGTLSAVLAAILILPPSIILLPGLQKKLQAVSNPVARIVQTYLRSVNRTVQKRPAFVVSSFLVAVIVCSIGVYNINTNEAPLSYFPEGASVRSDFLHVDSLYRGSYSIDLEFDSHREGGVHSPEFLNEMEKIRRLIENHPRRAEMMILKTISYVDFNKRMHMAMNEDNPQFYRIPESEELISGYHQVFSGKDDNADGRPDVIESYVDPLYRRAIMTLRIGEVPGRSVSTETAEKIRLHLLPAIEKELHGSSTTVRMTGLLSSYEMLKHYVVRGNIRGIGLAAVVIALFVFLVFRNRMASILSLVPILVSVWVVYGLMGFLRIPLDTVKAILSSIAIGIGVDDTIHFLKHYIIEERRTGSAASAVENTLKESGSAIVFTTLALVAGFAVTLVSSFSPVVHLGFLIIAVMVATTLSALYLLPALILLIRGGSNITTGTAKEEESFHAGGESAFPKKRLIHFIFSWIAMVASGSFLCITSSAIASPVDDGYRHMKIFDSLPEPRTAKMISALVIKRGDRTDVKEFEVYTVKYGQETRTRMIFTKPGRIDFLSHSTPGQDDAQWIKLPATGVRRIATGDQGASFVNSHFSYADMGAESIEDSTYEYLGEQTVDDARCFKIKAIKKRNRTYSHTDLFLRTADHVMVRADFYESGRHTKTMRFEKIEFIKGIPTPRKITMERIDGSGKTILYVRSVEYDLPVADSLFSQTGL